MVDAHVHLLPTRLQAAIRGFFDRYGIDSGRFAYPADHGDVCDRLAAEGVSEVWSLPYARRPGSAAGLNKSMAGLVAARRGGPVQVTGGCTVHPGDDQPLTIVRSAVEDMGLRVLKLHCSVGDFTPDDPRLGPVWEYSAEVALPVVLHAGHAADGHTDDHASRSDRRLPTFSAVRKRLVVRRNHKDFIRTGSVRSCAMREGIDIEVSAADRERLAAVVADRNSRQKHVWRARIILATGEGCGTAEIMRRAGVSKPCVWRWQERFMHEGVAGLLHDKTRKPGLPPLPSALVDDVVALTLVEPPGETTHWTGRAMAAASGISLRSVQRIWAAHGLQPHRVRRFKLSQDPAFAAKLRDVVGLYLDPPAHSLVLPVDEKSQIQGLDRTQPGLPIKKGRAGTMTHDYIRNGTTTLFAALNVFDGTVIGQCMARHRHQEFIRFLNRIKRRSRPANWSTRSSTTMPSTSIPRCAPGSRGIPGGCSISPRPRAPGPMRSKGSSPR